MSCKTIILIFALVIYSSAQDPFQLLRESIPGEPGQDYPVFSQVPSTSFSCQDRNRVDGGYYSDTEANCQSFHICSAGDENGFLVTHSFLCPNGTLFNQNYFVCDWWFNFDCSTAVSLYTLNDAIAAERLANNPQ